MRLPQNISRAIDAVARSAVGKDWSLYAGLLDHWGEIVGPDYAKETTPVKITFPHGKKTEEKWTSGKRTGGTLTISLPQGLTMEFSHQSEQIRGRVNGFFGYPAIERITFKPFYPSGKRALPVELRPLTKAEQTTLLSQTESIENSELKEVLQQLGASVLANQKKI